MSTLPSQPAVSPSWKDEINRRIAEHRNRKATPAAMPEEALSEAHHNASSRAAAAAARVAARYANAPSYSEMLAGEARAAVRAAEAASRAALEAQAAAESVLAGLEAASAAEPAWEPEFPERQEETAGVRAAYATDFFEVDMEDLRERVWAAQDSSGGEAIEVLEPAQPIHANLIEFPRELVATRKVRPRRAEGAFAAAAGPGAQLSIFEVDPGAILIGPVASDAMEVTASPAWTGPEWSGIELDAQPQREFQDKTPIETLEEAPMAAIEAAAVELAPLNLRLMAAIVNGSLIAGALMAAALVAATNVKDLPSPRAIELGGVLALLAAGALYQALFALLAKGTPGMRYAGISLCTFDGQDPTLAQRYGRLAALLLSLLPVGLGVVWALFDDDHLSWHDRLSRTYLRKS